LEITTIDNDLPDMLFDGPGPAYRWAEEMLSRPHVTSYGDLLLRDAPGVGPYGHEDFAELAQTIVVCVDSVEDLKAKAAFKTVYGAVDEDRYETMTVELAMSIRKHLCAMGKRDGQLLGLAGVCIFNQRLMTASGGKRRAYASRYAEAAGVDLSTLYKGSWMHLIMWGNNVFDGWVETACKVLRPTMKEKGIL
jgi:hypothetical protein